MRLVTDAPATAPGTGSKLPLNFEIQQALIVAQHFLLSARLICGFTLGRPGSLQDRCLRSVARISSRLSVVSAATARRRCGLNAWP